MCDKTIKNNSKSNHPNFKTHILKKEYGIVIKEQEIKKPEIAEKQYILKNVGEECRYNFFHTSEYRCFCDIKFSNIESIQQGFFTITLGYMKFQAQFQGSNKKFKIANKN